MTTVELDSIAQELAQLRAELHERRAATGEPAAATRKSGRRVRTRWSAPQRVAVVVGIAIGVAAVMGVAGAAAPGDTADVTYIPLTVPHKILSNTAIAKGATTSPVVIGASTTVPSDATSVQLTVAVKSTAAGTLSVFPADHAASTTTATIAFASGNVVGTQVTRQNPGLSGKMSLKNNGTATATVTVTITGYSTQTTASNISGKGGASGQVLTNNGTGGATWKNIPLIAANGINPAGGSAGQVLTNTGTGSSWATAKITGWTTAASNATLSPHSEVDVFATCPTGTVVLGGGAGSGTGAVVSSSFPWGTRQWRAIVDNPSDYTIFTTVWAICANG